MLDGGLFAMAMPRGSGKTTLCGCACIWAVLYGHRDVRLPDRGRGRAGTRSTCWRASRLNWRATSCLLEDFPEVGLSHPVPGGDRQPAAGPDSTRASRRTSAGPPTRSSCRPSPAARPAAPSFKLPASPGADPRHESSAADGTIRPAVTGGDRRSADDESARSPIAVRHARERSWPAPSWAWRARARRSPASCPAP